MVARIMRQEDGTFMARTYRDSELDRMRGDEKLRDASRDEVPVKYVMDESVNIPM